MRKVFLLLQCKLESLQAIAQRPPAALALPEANVGARCLEVGLAMCDMCEIYCNRAMRAKSW